MNSCVLAENRKLMNTVERETHKIEFKQPMTETEWYRHAYEVVVKGCDAYFQVNKTYPTSIHMLVKFLSEKGYGKQFIDKISLMI